MGVRRAGVAAAAGVAGALLCAGPAAADVSVSPGTAVQASGADLTFHVTNPGTAAVTRLTLVMPPDSPIAEVYPLSMADWAPDIEFRQLPEPLTAIHGGSPVTQAPKDIVWIAMPGKSLAPGASVDLGVSLGPMPTLSRIAFTVIPAYAGGASGTPMPPVSISLTPAPAGQADSAHAAHGAPAPAADDPIQAEIEKTVADAQRGSDVWTVSGWVAAGLAVLGMAALLLRRRRPETDPAEAEPAGADPAGAEAETGTADPRAAADEPAADTVGPAAGASAAATAGDAADPADGPEKVGAAQPAAVAAAGSMQGAADRKVDAKAAEEAGGNTADEPVSAGAARITAWSYRDGPQQE